MACYTPLRGFVGPLNENGKRPVVFKAPAGTERMDPPCGKCVGCRLEYAKNWAIRCMHEAQTHADNCVVTLTFDREHLPPDGSLDVRYFQLFCKLLRKRRGPFRFFHAGEYGGKLGRPHHHALLFGIDFPDKVLKTVRNGKRFYESASLKEIWTHGFHSIGDLDFASASYVARYCVKKVSGKSADEHYVNRQTGLLLKPEFTTMSRRPGIGAKWLERFRSDVYPSDGVVFNGRIYKPPRYYDNELDKVDPDLLESLRYERSRNRNVVDNTDERLIVRERIVQARLKSFNRSLGGSYED